MFQEIQRQNLKTLAWHIWVLSVLWFKTYHQDNAMIIRNMGVDILRKSWGSVSKGGIDFDANRAEAMRSFTGKEATLSFLLHFSKYLQPWLPYVTNSTEMFKILLRGMLRWAFSCNAHESINWYFEGWQFGKINQEPYKCSILCPSIPLLRIRYDSKQTKHHKFPSIREWLSK